MSPAAGFVIREFREEDAGGVAALLNASDRAWPGTLTGGIPYTAERVLKRHRERAHLAVLIAEAEGRVVGYLTLTPHWANPAAGYVGFLNVHPGHHGRGIGKALLLEAISIATRLGLPYLGIDTWSGNERAIGLYKRTGFFWVPGTNVHMENYLPTILRLPGVADFLSGAHWYDCLVREISLEEDDEDWHGRAVYRYRFERAGEGIEVLIDAGARAPCAVRLPGMAAELAPAVGAPCVGLPFAVRFRVENPSGTGKSYALFLRGDRGVSLAGGELVDLGPGEAHEGEAECVLTEELADLPPRRPAPAARLLVLADAGKAELALGFRRRFPLELSLHPTRRAFRPGEEVEVSLVLRNRSDRRLVGDVSLEAEGGVRVEPRSVGVDFPPGGEAVVPLRVRGEPGAWRLRPRAAVGGTELGLPPLPLLFRGPAGGAVGCATEGMAILAGEGFTVEAQELGGRLVLFPEGGVHPLMRQGEELGPPYAPADLGQRRWTQSLAHEEDGVELTMRTASDRFPGVEVEKRLRLGRGPVLELSYALVNRGREPATVSLRISHWDLPDLPVRIAYMSPEGLIRDVLAGFPEGSGDFPEELPEGWLAFEFPDEGRVIGLVPEGEVEWACEWGWSWVTRPAELPPGERRLYRYFLYVGPGDFRAVRDLWGRISGASPARVEPRPFLWPGFPRPLVLRGAEGTLAITVRSGRGRPAHGTLRVSPPPGLRMEPGEGEFETRIGRPAAVRVRWRREGEVRAGLGELVLAGAGEERRFPLACVSVPERPPVVSGAKEAGREVLVIAEGARRLAVAPDFGPSLFSWREGGTEVLRSAFPEPGRFAWLRPWFGGIHPILYPVSLEEWNWPGKLHRERFEATPWRGRAEEMELVGVALRSRPRDEALRGTEIEVLYATPGGGILVTALRVRNPTPVPRELGGGFMGFLAPGGTHGDTRIETPGYVRIRSPYHAWWEVRGWALVRGRNDAAFLLCAPPEVPIAPWDVGEEGGHLALGREFRLGPGEEGVIWGWWVYLFPGEDPAPWRELSRLRPAG